MKNKYKNPWRNENDYRDREKYFENNARLVLEYKNFKVYEIHDTHFDFVYGEMCIAQRAGVTKAKEVIDKIIDEVRNYPGEEEAKHFHGSKADNIVFDYLYKNKI